MSKLRMAFTRTMSNLPRGRRALAPVAAAAAGIIVIAFGAGVAAAATQHVSSADLSSSVESDVKLSNLTTPADTAGFAKDGPGIFTDSCKKVTTAPNDPILMPGMTGKSMQHDFFGNLDPSASSTPAKLLGGKSSCSTSADASAYWTPVLYQNGVALHPSSTLIYWRAPKTVAASVQTIPVGLTMIAGNEAATTPQGVGIVKWMCANDPGRGSPTPMACASGQDLRLVITFPSCWDGHTLGGAGQKNVVYPASGSKSACPASHPVRIPQVVFHANYPTSTVGNLTLSIGPTQTGPTTTEHADFMNGWNHDAFTADVTSCISTITRCGQVRGDAATPRGDRSLARQ